LGFGLQPLFLNGKRHLLSIRKIVVIGPESTGKSTSVSSWHGIMKAAGVLNMPGNFYSVMAPAMNMMTCSPLPGGNWRWKTNILTSWKPIACPCWKAADIYRFL
jgi:hypothetical protein